MATKQQIGQLASVKQERVRAAERLLRVERERAAAAEAAVQSRREALAQSEAVYAQSRRYVLEGGARDPGFARVRAADAYSQKMFDAAELRRKDVAEAEAALAEQQQAVAHAVAALHAACRGQEKTRQQRESMERQAGLAQARRQDLELQDFMEARGRRDALATGMT